MRLRRFFPLAPFACLVLVSCAEVTPPPRIQVSQVSTAGHSSREEGDSLKLTRWDFEARPGLKRGYFVVRSEPEWRGLWPTVDVEKVPLLPPGIDFSKELMIVAAPTDVKALDVRVKQVIESREGGVHVYVAREMPGEGCKGAKDEGGDVPVDVVRIPKVVTDDYHVHVETLHDEPCTPPPEATVICRPNGTTGNYTEHLVVQPGTVVACLSQETSGTRPTIDRTWAFRTLPLGTAAKMTIASGGQGISFNTDAYGTYEISLEVSDDLGRVGKARTDVEVAPPKDTLAVQMLWTKFDPTDDPSTFPRVELHVATATPPDPAKLAKYGKLAARETPWILMKGDCTLTEWELSTSPPPSGGADANASPKPGGAAATGPKVPPWCKARVVGPTTLEEITTDASPQFRIGVHYVDDRYAGQPVLCVRTFRGKVSGEWCDNHVRQGGDWWDVARIDAATGKAVEIVAPAAPVGAAAAATGAKPVAGAAGKANATATPNATPAPTPTAKPNPTPNAKTASPSASASASAPASSSAPAPRPKSPAPKSSADPWTP